MILGLLVLIIALTISAVAIYYSVAGLVAIFAAAALPIMIMGGALEIGKLVTAVWLHRYWDQARWWLRTYLALAVLVLMFITSMGIFGFLSKAHIEQTSASTESVAQVERLTTEIARQNDVVARAELKINSLQTSGTGADANVQSQIDKEQQRIDTAYSRIQPAIDEQNAIIGSQAKLFQDELDRIDTAMQTVAGYIDSGDKENYKKAQAIIGVKPDGAFGSGSTRAYTAWKDAKNAERQVLLTNIQQATNNPQARAAATEIKRLRTTVETQIAESNKLINRLRANIGKTDKTADIDAQVDEQNARIKTANESIDTLTEEKYTLETEYRKLEAEVGPIKYIAEFVYGEEADKNMLEKAVTWVIVIIIFVFDPLAVLLLIAAQYTFEFHRKTKDDDGERLRLERAEYERARAQRIVGNPGYEPDDGPLTDKQLDEIQQSAWMFRQESKNDNGRTVSTEETTGDDALGAGHDGGDTSERMAMAGKGDLNDNDAPNETDNTAEHEPVGESLPGQTISTDDEGHSSMEQTEVQYDGLTATEVADSYIEKKDSSSVTEELLEELKQARVKELAEQDDDITISEAKRSWKDEHPFETIKEHKEKYINGEIDTLPWQVQSANKYIMKDRGEQIVKEINPELPEAPTENGYIQNAEQQGDTLWKRIKDSGK